MAIATALQARGTSSRLLSTRQASRARSARGRATPASTVAARGAAVVPRPLEDGAVFARAMEESLAASTRKAYARVLSDFFDYMRHAGVGVRRGDELLTAVGAFLGAKMRAGAAPAIGRQLYAALCLYWPEWVSALRPMHRALKGWDKVRPVVKRPPLVWPLAVAMAVRLTAQGHPSLGVAVVLAHHCYLRIGELVRVETSHVVGARSVRTGFANRFGFLHIPRAKTGTNQDVAILDPAIAWLLAVAVRAAGGGEGDASMTLPTRRVFPMTEAFFRAAFARCARSYGLPRSVVPHSLRHGGATRDYTEQRLSVDEIRIRGRWKGEKSMLHYVGQMRSALATLHVPPRAVHVGDALAKHLVQAFEGALRCAPDSAEVRAYQLAIENRRRAERSASNAHAHGHRSLRPPTARRGDALLAPTQTRTEQ